MVQCGLESGIERIGQNIREAGMLDKQEKKSEDQSVYGINQIEAAAGTAAHAAYVLGRKLAQKQKEIKKLQHSQDFHRKVHTIHTITTLSTNCG